MERDIDLNKVKRSDIAGLDEFYVRGAIVSKELANNINIKGVSFQCRYKYCIRNRFKAYKLSYLL